MSEQQETIWDVAIKITRQDGQPFTPANVEMLAKFRAFLSETTLDAGALTIPFNPANVKMLEKIQLNREPEMLAKIQLNTSR